MPSKNFATTQLNPIPFKEKLVSSSKEIMSTTQKVQQLAFQNIKQNYPNNNFLIEQESKQPIKCFNFVKTPNNLEKDDSLRFPSSFLPVNKSISREPNLTNTFQRRPILLNRDVYKSHEKIPSKIRTVRELAQKANLQPVTINQSHLSDRVKVIHNLYCKENRYFYSGRIDLKSIVRGIYYNGQTVESLEEYSESAFKRTTNKTEFLNVIYEEGKQFSSSVNMCITAKINKLIDKNDENSLSFIPFISNIKKYKKAVDQISDYFHHLFQVNVEIEKLTHQFMNFLKERNNAIFEGFNFHSKLFAFYIFKHQLITTFIEYLYQTFEQSPFLKNGYNGIAKRIIEIYIESKKFIHSHHVHSKYSETSASTNCNSIRNDCVYVDSASIGN